MSDTGGDGRREEQTALVRRDVGHVGDPGLVRRCSHRRSHAGRRDWVGMLRVGGLAEATARSRTPRSRIIALSGGVHGSGDPHVVQITSRVSQSSPGRANAMAVEPASSTARTTWLRPGHPAHRRLSLTRSSHGVRTDFEAAGGRACRRSRSRRSRKPSQRGAESSLTAHAPTDHDPERTVVRPSTGGLEFP